MVITIAQLHSKEPELEFLRDVDRYYLIISA